MVPENGAGRSPSKARAHLRRHGMTMIELMVVVLILGILAAIATPLYIGYVNRAKAGEAVVVLAEIRQQQESYHSIPGGNYCNVSGSWDKWFPSSNPSDTQQPWEGQADVGPWTLFLGRPHPQGMTNTYFSYETIAGRAGTTPAGFGAPDNRGYTGNDSWFIARALGDLDGDNENVTFEISNQSKNVSISHTAGWE